MLRKFIIITVMIGILAVIIGCGDSNNNTANTINTVTDKKESETKVTKLNYLIITQNKIQGFFKSDSEQKNIGVPDVDCKLIDHWENDADGLVYVKGTFTLSSDKLKHSYNARYGVGTDDIVYLAIDSKKILFDANKQAKYMDKASKK